MSVSDEKLMAFADGELSDLERAAIEAKLAQEPGLREKLAAHQRLRARLSTAFDGVLNEPAPARLLKAADASPTADVVVLADRRRARWSVREWSAMAASLATGLLVGVAAMDGQAPLVETSDSGLIAHGALARALESQLASDQAGAVRIGLSFRATDGSYCRTFDLVESATAGLACRQGNAWNVAMTAANGGGGELRQAGASDQILSTVEVMIDGDPLDAQSEAAARDAGWR